MSAATGVRAVPGNENSLEIEELARFAVDEHNKKENALLEFVRVVKAKEQIWEMDASKETMYYLTLEAKDGGKKKLYEAKVWVKMTHWIGAMNNFKELQEFKPVGDAAAAHHHHHHG
uniref:K33-specific affimer n=1 Tax=synthetic construct TaxID=32630 RepID=UPI000BBD49D3|nr:Chain B, K33-specific affimer [synthetic construct]5OHM_D Chain D, K33-specific affimer [synthetic construct]5OHM_F Chain F, K33-specific affimer [synthetic construct]5OHM_H Chain H, K33-specific affimer [synthetic construct]5OHM_J Chain J, K33-specific affimer [synthetic construct]5OHM_L Chain L, K33-specific affimer [synthetic construct]5OHV_B Chain B, K33-specific affimer [synthetic construct]5OHV_D Chain D, K33-specific affimer [synthetic construct]